MVARLISRCTGVLAMMASVAGLPAAPSRRTSRGRRRRRGPDPVKPDGAVQGNDAWVDPKGSGVGAGPVYELLGRTGLGTTEVPPIGTAVTTGDLGFRQHTEGHTPGPTWPTFLEFADKYMGCGC